MKEGTLPDHQKKSSLGQGCSFGSGNMETTVGLGVSCVTALGPFTVAYGLVSVT